MKPFLTFYSLSLVMASSIAFAASTPTSTPTPTPAAVTPSSSKSAPQSLVSQSVGQVGDRVIPSREVQISAVLDRILFPVKDGSGKASSALFEVRPGDPAMLNELTALLLEAVVFREAESFSVAKVSDEEVQQAVKKVDRAVAGKSYWEKLEVSDNELRKTVREKLTAKAFIQFKTSSMVGIVSDSEASAYYEKNRLKFGEGSFDSFKENIKTFLARQQLEDRTRAWFEIIKRKYKVRNILVDSLNSRTIQQ